jgi:predicted O-methyltransferase YrrM
MRVQMGAAAVLREIEETPAEMSIGPVRGRHLAETVRRSGARRVLEIGTFVGYSAILIAGNLPEDGRVVTIEMDPWSAARARENFRKANLADRISLHVGDAADIIPRLRDEFDLLFIDANKDGYLDHLKLCEGKLKKGGVVFADNVKAFAGPMRDFLDYVRRSGAYESEYIDAGYDGVEISKKLF